MITNKQTKITSKKPGDLSWIAKGKNDVIAIFLFNIFVFVNFFNRTKIISITLIWYHFIIFIKLSTKLNYNNISG